MLRQCYKNIAEHNTAKDWGCKDPRTLIGHLVRGELVVQPAPIPTEEEESEMNSQVFKRSRLRGSKMAVTMAVVAIVTLLVFSMVSGAIEQTSNSIPEKYCYDNISSNCDIWGGLYQWGEAVQYYNGASNTTSWNPAPTGNVTGICPADWHLPTNTEWDVLCATLGGTGVAGGKLKETGTIHWNSPNAGATNSSGFTALAGGIRHIDQNFIGMMNYNQFWTTTQNSDNAYYRSMNYNYEYVTSNMYWKTTGSSIRCIQN